MPRVVTFCIPCFSLESPYSPLLSRVKSSPSAEDVMHITSVPAHDAIAADLPLPRRQREWFLESTTLTEKHSPDEQARVTRR